MCSLLIEFRVEDTQQTKRLAASSKLFLRCACRTVTQRQSDFVTGLWTPQTGIPEPVTAIRQPVQMMDLQLCFDQLLTWPTDQPRHATTTLSNPVEADRPPFWCADADTTSGRTRNSATHIIVWGGAKKQGKRRC